MTRITSVEQPAANPFALRESSEAARAVEPLVHVLREGVRCDTERRGHETPRGQSPLTLVVEASEGFIPLWEQNTTLRWRFRDSSFESFQEPEAAKAAVERLLAEAILAWGDAAPVKFTRRDDAWDFEVVIRQGDDCSVSGCVLASAFFPDAGRHKLLLYPKLFEQSREEQVETLVHEIGHIFGLRHFFAKVSETAWPAEIFGTHQKFSIMNYGDDSRLTDEDRSDLYRLYRMAWAGSLTHVNGTPLAFVKPFHVAGDSAASVAVLAPAPATPLPSPRVLRTVETAFDRDTFPERTASAQNRAEGGRLDRIAEIISRGRQRGDEDEGSGNDVHEFAREQIGEGFVASGLGRTSIEVARSLRSQFRENDFERFDFEKFSRRIERLGLGFINPIELLYLGASNESGSCAGRNHLPEEELWSGIENTARMLDAIRTRLGGPVRILSAYRSSAYNRCVGGESASSHLRFNAIDWRSDVGDVRDWLDVARDVRSSDSDFRGGIGYYPRQGFIHIDTRGREANWP